MIIIIEMVKKNKKVFLDKSVQSFLFEKMNGHNKAHFENYFIQVLLAEAKWHQK
jgi:hypothetical protein